MRVRATVGVLAFCGLVGGALASVAATPEQAARRSAALRIKLVGQALIKADLRRYAPVAMEQARRYLAGSDVVFTNLEAAVAAPDAPVKPRSANAIHGSPEVIDCLKDMGFNLLSLSNNHALDLGTAGILTTIAEVDKRGLVRAGTGRNAEEAAAPGYLDTPAGKVALVGIASGASQLTPETWAAPGRPGVNYLEMLPDGSLNPEHKARILGAVKEAASRARLVVVYHHNHFWGEARGVDGPPGRERRIDRFETARWWVDWTHELIDAGAGLYVAHGNPALHGVEIYKGRPILYGLGNYIFQLPNDRGFDRYGPLAWYSAVAEVEFDDDKLKAIKFRPLALSMDGTADAPRGVPYLAQGGEAATILGRLAELSRRHGTEMRVDATSAEVILRK